MEPSSHNGKPVNEIETGNKNIKTVFRTSAIFGANASGKSNFVDAILFLRNSVANSYSNSIESEFKLETYALGSNTNPISSFEIKYIRDEFIYRYGFSIDRKKVHKEYLYYADIKGGSEKVIFDRADKESTFDADIIPNSMWLLETISTRLFLSELINNRNSNDSHIIRAYLGIREINIVRTNSNFNTYMASLAKVEEHTEKERIIKFLSEADFNISDIKVKDLGFDEVFKMKNTELISTHKTEDGRDIDFNFNSFESDGTKVVFALSGLIINSLEWGQPMVIDEMDRSLHPVLVKYIINMFNNPEINKRNAQLIFTSHSHYLMDGETLSRDQIWLASKENGFHSKLYSLGDFKELKRKKDKFYNEYMYGIFGAIPNINEDL